MKMNKDLMAPIAGSVLNAITSMAASGITTYYNNKNARENRELQRTIEENRLKFEKNKFEENCKLQKKLLREQNKSALEQMQKDFLQRNCRQNLIRSI